MQLFDIYHRQNDKTNVHCFLTDLQVLNKNESAVLNRLAGWKTYNGRKPRVYSLFAINNFVVSAGYNIPPVPLPVKNRTANNAAGFKFRGPAFQLRMPSTKTLAHMVRLGHAG